MDDNIKHLVRIALTEIQAEPGFQADSFPVNENDTLVQATAKNILRLSYSTDDYVKSWAMADLTEKFSVKKKRKKNFPSDCRKIIKELETEWITSYLESHIGDFCLVIGIAESIQQIPGMESEDVQDIRHTITLHRKRVERLLGETDLVLKVNKGGRGNTLKWKIPLVEKAEPETAAAEGIPQKNTFEHY